MSKSEHRLWLAKRIDRRNAGAMTKELGRLLAGGADMLTLIDRAQIMKWPHDAHEAAQVRYDQLAMEILTPRSLRQRATCWMQSANARRRATMSKSEHPAPV